MENKVIIIAEAGVNHNGCIKRARQMVKAAKEAGVDYVKFQTAVPELVISSIAPKAEYQKQTTGEEQSQLEMCKAIHLPLSDYAELKALCEAEGVGFMSTPFDLVSIDLLCELGQDWMKVPSGEITNLPYLRKIAAAGMAVFLGAGRAGAELLRLWPASFLLSSKAVRSGHREQEPSSGIKCPGGVLCLPEAPCLPGGSHSALWFFNFIKNTYLFIFGCTGSLLLYEGFSSCSVQASL